MPLLEAAYRGSVTPALLFRAAWENDEARDTALVYLLKLI